MQPIAKRSLTDHEAAVITAVLYRAPIRDRNLVVDSDVESLKVVGRCDCGCDSLFFEGIEKQEEQARLADGLGYTTVGDEIGIILWGSKTGPVHLELYNYTEHPARLPQAESVCPYEQARQNRE